MGYAFNLVRTAPGFAELRATLFWTLFGRLLVFETLAHAEAYRMMVTQQLHGSMNDVVTLDGRKIKATGVVCGSSFSVVPFEKAGFRFAVLAADEVRSRCCARMHDVYAYCAS